MILGFDWRNTFGEWLDESGEGEKGGKELGGDEEETSVGIQIHNILPYF
jgi:hypothetical protein